MLPGVNPAREAVEFETDERCHIQEISNDADDELVSIARARVEPGVTTAWHSLDGISERYIIVSVDSESPIPVQQTCFSTQFVRRPFNRVATSTSNATTLRPIGLSQTRTPDHEIKKCAHGLTRQFRKSRRISNARQTPIC
jgi:hypothetical protein